MPMSAADQYLLEMMNRGRLDPVAEAARYGIDLNAGLEPGTISATSKQVLAPNEYLDQAATQHSKWMLDTDTFSHTGSGGTMPWDRATNAGYKWSAIGENIAWSGTTGLLDLKSAVDTIQKNLFLSAGHRENLLNNTYREVGVAVETGVFKSGSTYNAAMATELFGLAGSKVFLTGVVYTDNDKNLFYSMGEGRSGVKVTAQGLSDTSESAGGYSVGLTASSAVAVTGTSGGIAFSCIVNMSAGNVKLDLVSGITFFASGSITLQTGIQNVTLLGLNGLSAAGNDSANILTGNGGNNLLDGKGGDDKVSGGGGNDQMIGGSGRDNLIGAAGADRLSGGNDADTLAGSGGNDILIGGTGNDRMTGGDGLDTFVFVDNDGKDIIQDYSLPAKDVLQLDNALWGNAALSDAQIVSQFAKVVADGVLFDFGDGQTLLLTGLTTTAGLSAQIDVI